jgi:hypothetical protein
VASDRRESLGADLVIPLLALAFAAYFFVSIADLAWEAKANGVLIGTVLVVLITLQAVRIGTRLARGTGVLSFDRLLQPHYAQRKRIGMVLLTVLFIAAIKWLGLTLSLFLAMAASLYVMGVRKRAHLFWVSFAVAAAAYLMFVAALDSDIPHGPVEKLIAALR